MKNNGACFEGMCTEIGGLIQQDTNGKIEFLRHKTTNEPDGGIDSEYKSKLDFFKYLKPLKEEEEEKELLLENVEGGGAVRKQVTTRILQQDKDNSGKLGKNTVKNAVSKFKENYPIYKDSEQPLAGFLLAGGEGMTNGAQEYWKNEFEPWCAEKHLKAEYIPKNQMEKIRDNLRNRVENKNMNKNR